MLDREIAEKLDRPRGSISNRRIKLLGRKREEAYEEKLGKVKKFIRKKGVCSRPELEELKEELEEGVRGKLLELEALKFLKRLRKSCEEGSIIYTDHGPWYLSGR